MWNGLWGGVESSQEAPIEVSTDDYEETWEKGVRLERD